MRVEVVWADARAVLAKTVEVDEHATVRQAIDQANMADVAWTGIAIHGEQVAQDRRLAPGDRIELLRPLEQDPKGARRRRARDGA